MSEITQQAQKAIGTLNPTDYKLRPRSHVNKMEPEAAPLKTILENDELDEIIKTFEKSEEEAEKSQSRYKLLSWLSAYASFLAVFIASLLLLLYVFDIPEEIATLGVIIQLSLISISFICSLATSHWKIFNKWMHRRAEAEKARIDLFKKVIDSETDVKENELPLLPLKLEYFRRFQLAVQLLYYSKRGEDHKRALRIMNNLRFVALGLVVAAFIPVVLELLKLNDIFSISGENYKEAYQRSFVFLGILGSALQGLLASLSLISQHERNAGRYEDTHKNLEALNTLPLIEAREAAARGDKGPVLTFVALVHEQLSSEHREWIALSSLDPNLTLNKLKEQSLPQL